MYCYTCMNETDEGAFCQHCGRPLEIQAAAHHLTPGTLLNGKYVIGNFIGEGGFGITYIGRDRNLDIRIAIKEYYPCGYVNRNNDHSNAVTVTTADSGDFFEKGKIRFLQEARSIAKFPEEPGIVRVRDYFEENDTAYIVMEYLEGETLSQYVRGRGKMEASECISLMIPVMRSLEKFHQAGMIHRDISPDNIMYQKNGTLKLMDFGSARYFANHDMEMSVILKQGYSPEEQYRKKGKQGPWTDVYSLCASIYSCITGVIPENALDRLHKDALRRPSELGVSIRADQEDALMKGLAVSAENRWADMGELMAALGAAGDSKSRQPEFDPYKTYVLNEEFDTEMSRGLHTGPGTAHTSGQDAPVPESDKLKRLTAVVLIAAGICILFTVVSLVLIVPKLSDGKGETAAKSESSGDKDSGQKKEKDDGAIEVEKMKASEVKTLKKKYWRMNKDDLAEAEASSVIKQQEGVSNLPEYLFDNNIQTNWQEGVKGAGIDEYVAYRFQDEYRICAMSFKLGNWKTKEYYYGNNRPRTLTLSMNGQSWKVSFPDKWEQFGIRFTSAVKTSDLKITINDVYKGTDWNDTVITDIGVWYE